ncbi:hypothetical protein D9758_006009 [Tetrapyrgos nigripes]|uniref:C2H2-type domain-containing protein n=1 Tax=Tetrapyrgos nigripes TaxID=182062 RepID=A0A8H5FZB2_9AGAR|nr:hypothetical protein D9758_006009 [Tetrapyrgos nigripes]
MSHIFTLDDLARSKVCLEFVNQEQPPSIFWKPRSQPIPVNSSTSSLSIRVNQTFVNGRPSLTIFLIHDPESIDRAHQTPQDVFEPTNAETPLVIADNRLYPQESLPSEPDHNTHNTGNLPLYPSATTPNNLGYGYPSPYSNEHWADAPSRSEPQSRDSPASTPYTQMQSLALNNDENNSALFSSLSSFDMFFGGCEPSPEWPESSSTTGSPHTSLREFGSDAWSDQSESPPGDSSNLNVKEPVGVSRSRSAGRVSRRSSGYVSGGVQPRTNAANKKKRVQCSLCDETFSRRHDMMRHEASQHGKVQQWTCEMCRRFFSSEAMLTVHKCPALRS